LPVNAPGTLLFFWDYDTQWGADRSRLGEGAKDWGHLEFSHTDELLDLHAQYGVPACFAVVGSAALPGNRPYHAPDQVRRIHESGHEVASHSHRHEWLPGLTGPVLLETLRRSKDAIEQCIGGPVATFVPPYNQPFDYAAAGSISLAERREAGKDRTGLARLCDALRETGYRFCRVAYRPLHVRLAEYVCRRRLDAPEQLAGIRGVTCVRLNTPCGFLPASIRMLHRCAERGGFVVVYGHPHSLRSGNSQDVSQLLPFLREVKRLRESGRIVARLPRELVTA
jgi:peptidoglycan/xylan/chitin deacetylase (PgdA/CDA1 family)